MAKRTRKVLKSHKAGTVSRAAVKRAVKKIKKIKKPEDLLAIPKFLRRKPSKTKSSEIISFGRPDPIWITRAMRDDAKQEKQDEADVKAMKSARPSIQEAMREKLADHLGEVEAMVDNFTQNGTTNHNLFDYLKKTQVAQVHARKIADYYRPLVLEMEELMEKKVDEQLQEGFSHLKKKDVVALRDFYQTLIDDANAQVQSKRATRKSRTKKAPSKEKVVRRVNYLKESTDLKATSIQPIEILGAQHLWIFNTKSRKLIRYVASDQSGLFIKGTTILNYNTTESIQKTIRKPKPVIKDVINAGKVRLRRILGKIRAKETTPNGRLNKYTLILKVVK